jgi:hypothetical protein
VDIEWHLTMPGQQLTEKGRQQKVFFYQALCLFGWKQLSCGARIARIGERGHALQ